MGKLKLKGATLIEALVAMVILLLVTSISTITIFNVISSQNIRIKLKASLEITALAQEAIKKSNFVDERIEKGSIVLYKKVERYRGSKYIYLLDIKAMNYNKIIGERKELILENNKY